MQFTQRDAAERAAKECFNKLVIDGKRLTVKWGKPPSAQAGTGRIGDVTTGYDANYEPVPGLPSGTKPNQHFPWINILFFFSCSTAIE